MSSGSDAQLHARAMQLHTTATIVDYSPSRKFDCSQRIRQSGATVWNVTAAVPGDETDSAVRRIATYYDLLQDDGEFCLIEEVGDISQAKEAHKTGIVVSIQDPEPLIYTPGMVKAFHRLGLRICQLACSGRSFAADASGEAVNAGLSSEGRLLVEELNRVGVTIDLSHVGECSGLEAAELSNKPVICCRPFSSGEAGVNLEISNDLLLAVAAKGGVVYAAPRPSLDWSGRQEGPTINDYIEAIDRIVDLSGIDHVGIGTSPDVAAVRQPPMHGVRLSRRSYSRAAHGGCSQAPAPAGGTSSLDGSEGRKSRLLVMALIARGYDDVAIRKILGLNLVRVFSNTWK